MKKVSLLLGILLVAVQFLANAQEVSAKTAASSAALIIPIDFEKSENQKHVQILRAYLEKRDSPLAAYANTLVEEAEKNNLDWKLVAAISGLESSFGIHIPSDSYNGWGFGIYGDNVRRFASWDDGIATVSQSLRKDYMNKWNAQTIPEIGRIYAASPTWAVRVQSFMDAIDAFEENQSRTTLALSL